MLNPNGVILLSSMYSVEETINRLVVKLHQQDNRVYARINHQMELQSAGQKIRPLEFLLFGNPSHGGMVIAANPIAALDLPLKIIAWEDHTGKVWVAFNEDEYIKKRYMLMDFETSFLKLDKLVLKALKY